MKKNFSKVVLNSDAELFNNHSGCLKYDEAVSGKSFKMMFYDKTFKVIEQANKVICKETVYIEWNVPNCWKNQFLDWNESSFDVVAESKCSPNDTFDERKGKMIASAKAENIAYKEAFRRLNIIREEMNKFSDVCADAMRAVNNYHSHNIKFIEDVDNGTWKSKKQLKAEAADNQA